jgi:tetratricopeptide (TPR) repeat protein
MFLLSADKGEHLLEKMDNIGKPMLTQHGSFSLSVNYHAITQYYQLQKALVFNAYYVGNLNVTFIAMHKQPNQWKELSLAFELFMQDFNPESYFITKKHFEKHLNDMNFRQMIAYIKLSHFDARFFKQCIPSIFSFLPRLNPFEKKHLCQILERVWQMYYPIGESHDLGFDIGVILYQIDYYQDALFYFQYSEKNYRENAPLYFNIASCYFQLEDDIKCSEYIAKTLILESTHQGALELYEQLNRIKK